VRVLAMCHAFVPHHNAGAELTLHTELRHLVDRGHHVEVLLSRPMTGASEPYVIDGVRVHPFVRDNDPIRQFQQYRPNIVIAHLENTPRAAALGDQYKVPVAHLIHNDHEFTRGAYRRGPTQLAVFNTEWIRDEFEADWKFRRNGSPPPSVVVKPPVDPAPLLGVTGPRDRITLINLNEEKGGRLFWELTRMANYKFLGVRGAYGVQEIPATVPQNTALLDHQKPADMPKKVYARTKILLMPSSYESYGRTAIEAAHFGIPTIAHPTPGLREALGGAGTFVDRADFEGWVLAIKRLMTPKGYAEASRNAKELAASLVEPTRRALDLFADAMEGAAGRGFATITRRR
jgi:glycosyltransferase involved in cell wall biosynthesis